MADKKTTRRIPPAPRDLLSAGRAYWRTVLADFDLDGDQLRLLHAACAMLDRAGQAAAEIAKSGLFVVDRHGQTIESPAAKIERASRLAFARLRRELDLTDPPPDSRPPRGANYS